LATYPTSNSVRATDRELARTEGSPFGKRYVVESIMNTPVGRTPVLRSVWFIETGAETPRFVTAYPVRRDDDERA
jgi:hypothetical protein